jgi:Pyruvate/2-oxoacid:ferredoxin oxidoreductase gamma subunit
VLPVSLTKMIDAVRLESVCSAIMKKFPGKVGEMNVVAATAAHNSARKA